MSETDKPVHPRKIEIVHAAVTCFLDRGYHQTGVRDIARQAGISLGNLYNHFKGKEAVLVFIAEIEVDELSEMIERLSDHTDPKAALERFIAQYAYYVSRPENALLGVEILTEALRNPMIAEVFGRNRGLLTDALAGCLLAGSKSNVFGSLEDAHTASCLILDTLEGYGLRSLSEKCDDRAATRTLQTLLINALRP